ncbi:hypothetical protein LINPERHAP2_LOCUS12887, partial [Linum perenne]
MAEAAGVPYVNPYLNKSLDHTYDTNFTVGARREHLKSALFLIGGGNDYGSF